MAIIRTGGKQYLVKPHQTLQVEKLSVQAGESVEFETLLTADESGKNIKVGTPTLSTKVKGSVVQHGKAKKVDVIKFKAKVRYSRKYGHRQPYTSVLIGEFV